MPKYKIRFWNYQEGALDIGKQDYLRYRHVGSSLGDLVMLFETMAEAEEKAQNFPNSEVVEVNHEQ